MSPSNVRVIAAGIALIVSVLTGIVAGWVGAQTGTCVRQVQSVPTSQAPTQGQGPGQGLGDKQGEAKTVVSQSGSCDNSFSVKTAAIGFVGSAIAGGAAVAFLFLGRREDRTALSVASAPPAGGDPGLAHRAEQAEGERASLVQTCVYVRDRATSKAIADTLGRALSDVGVTTVAPVGVRFDPAHHEAGGATPTRDPQQAGTIAAVEVPGYVDRGVVLRAPVVTVYKEEGRQ
ncbi:MAG TPA: nucleotide exchange factor GrpE [Actinocatenispora sp.]